MSCVEKLIHIIIKINNYFLMQTVNKAIMRSLILANTENLILLVNTKLLIFLTFVKINLMQNQKEMIDLVVIDQPYHLYRYKLIYLLYNSMSSINLYVWIANKELRHLKTSSHIYDSSQWLEREAWDFFGIYFSGNIDLRKLITDYGYKYNPLKKTFPLGGHHEYYYININKKITKKEIRYSQKFRKMYI